MVPCGRGQGQKAAAVLQMEMWEPVLIGTGFKGMDCGLYTLVINFESPVNLCHIKERNKSTWGKK